MERYEKYKDTGIEWIGEIPEHWEVKRLSYILSVLTDYTANGSFASLASNVEYYHEENYSRLIRLTDLRENLKNEGVWVNQHAHEFLKKSELFGGEILMANVGAYAGLVCLMPYVNYKATLAPNMFLLKFKVTICNKFIYYLLNSERYFRIIANKALSSAQPKLNKDDIKEIMPVIPPLSEQTTIATYLDRKTTEIDQIIANKQKLIALYEEEKQAIINQAVTKGLDTNLKMKDSGVEWLGEIPEHWEVTKINRYIKVKDGTHETPTYLPPSDENFPLITSKDFNNGDIDFDDAKYISKDDHFNIIKRSNTEKGDILMSMIGGNIGNMVLVNTDRQFSIKNVCLFKTSQSIYTAKFLYYILKSPLLKIQIDLNSRGGAQGFLSLDDLRNLVYIVLPQNEMIEIVDFIEKECARLDTIIEKFNKQIDLLKEYRTTLISEVVTGKIKVC